MRRHAKASTAGSTRRQASRLRRIGIVAAFALALVAFLGITAPAALADAQPTIATNPASEIGVTTALLSGAVNPHGELGSGPTAWHIDYRPAGSEEWLTLNSGTIEGAEAESHPAPGEESNPVEVSTPFGYFGESQPGESYEFRLLASNNAGSAITPSPLSFTLNSITEPVLATEATEDIGLTKATLHGSVNPEGGNSNPLGSEVFSIYWQLQYSSDGSNWNTGNEGSIEGAEAESSSPIEFEAELPAGALLAGQTYYVRMHANYFNFSREAESPQPYDSFETAAAQKPLATIEAPTSVTDNSAQLAGTVNPNAPEEAALLDEDAKAAYTTSWHFECAPACSVGPTGPQPIPADNQPQTVEAALTGLQPHTTYTVSLHASNAAGETVADEIAGQPVTFTTEALPPDVETTTNAPFPGGKALLRGFVNPHNSALADCHFAYGPTASYGQQVPCEPSSPSGNNATEVTAHLTGLTPGATYHYALIADNGVGPALSGADGHFTALAEAEEPSCPNAGRLGSNFLPDCRAWELVSPPDKNGGDIVPDSQRTRAAADGSATDFYSLQNFADSVGGSVATDYLAERSTNPEPGDSGWSTHAITPPQESVPVIGILGGSQSRYVGEFSPNLDSGVFLAWSPLTADPDVANVTNLYLRTNLLSPGAGSYQLLTACPRCSATETPLPPLPAVNVPVAGRLRPRLAAASPDLSHLIFESRQNLTSDAPAQPVLCNVPQFGGSPCRARLYESDQGTLRLAGRIPAAPAISCDDSGGPACVAADVSIAGQGAGASHVSTLPTPHTISDGSDGHTRVFFTFPTNNGTTPNSTSSAGKLYVRLDGAVTDQLNASERTDCAGDPSCGGDGVPDPVSTPFAPANYLDAGADGKRAFFITTQALTDDASSDGESKIYMYDTTEPASAPHNLTLLGTNMVGIIGASVDGHYVYLVGAGYNGRISLWHDGARVDVGPTPNASLENNLASGGSWDLHIRRARVSPDGLHLLWSTSNGAGLTGADHGNCSGNPCNELYLYSAATDTLQCVACPPGGAPASADASDVIRTAGGGSSQDHHENHPVSADGRYVFFSTAEPLVDEDTNGISDAYAFDSRTGQAHLLSSGTASSPSWFLDASADGSDAFIATKQPLVGWDRDASRDVYDVRVNGGFPEPPPPIAPCNGDSCKPAGTPAPAASPQSSATLEGPGNPHPHHCSHGRRLVRRHGTTRCLSRHRHHARHTNPNRRASR